MQVEAQCLGGVLRVEVECVGPWGLALSRVTVRETRGSGIIPAGLAQEFGPGRGQTFWLGRQPAELCHKAPTNLVRLLPLGCGAFTVTGAPPAPLDRIAAPPPRCSFSFYPHGRLGFQQRCLLPPMDQWPSDCMPDALLGILSKPFVL